VLEAGVLHGTARLCKSMCSCSKTAPDSAPLLCSQILLTNAGAYSKGLLSEILDFVMGTGLIPADGQIWRSRRRAIVPSLHKKYIAAMVRTGGGGGGGRRLSALPPRGPGAHSAMLGGAVLGCEGFAGELMLTIMPLH
jgi:hypothetical protein